MKLLLKQLKKDKEIFKEIFQGLDKLRVGGNLPREVLSVYWLAANRYQVLSEITFSLETAEAAMKR